MMLATLVIAILLISAFLVYVFHYRPLIKDLTLFLDGLDKLTSAPAASTEKRSLSDCMKLTLESCKNAFLRIRNDAQEKVMEEVLHSKPSSLQDMIDEIVTLSADQKVKERIEVEISDARFVQENFIPPPVFENAKVRIGIHSIPASECSGDWWFYTEIEGMLFVMIGDATGHGLPAALLTAAARASVSLIGSFGTTSPSQILRHLNHAIHQTFKGKMAMTFTVISIDLKTGELTVANASHEPSALFRSAIGKATFLLDENGPILGLDDHLEYKESHHSLESGDVLMMYTDGIIELKTESSRTLSERNFISFFEGSVVKSSIPIEQRFNEIVRTAGYHLSGADDFSLLFIEMK